MVDAVASVNSAISVPPSEMWYVRPVETSLITRLPVAPNVEVSSALLESSFTVFKRPAASYSYRCQLPLASWLPPHGIRRIGVGSYRRPYPSFCLLAEKDQRTRQFRPPSAVVYTFSRAMSQPLFSSENLTLSKNGSFSSVNWRLHEFPPSSVRYRADRPSLGHGTSLPE